MAVSHIDADQRAYGPQHSDIPGAPVQWFINPVGIQSLIFSATEFGPSTVLTTDTLEPFSVNANLLPRVGSSSSIQFPLLQGMGFVTAKYTYLQPTIQSGVFFRSFDFSGTLRPGVFKYRIILEDGKIWLLYATPSNGQFPEFQRLSNALIQGPPLWSGIIQVAKNPAGWNGEATYDISAGVYPIAANITASKIGSVGSYTITWTKEGLFPAPIGQPPPLLMFALPHHVQTFNGASATGITYLKLQTTTKGMATAMLGDFWTMVEPNLPTDLGFEPWTPQLRARKAISSRAIDFIIQIALSELKQDMHRQTNLDSMYFSGKALSKFATLVYTTHQLLSRPDLAAQGLSQLKNSFARFTSNNQIYPLVYDTVWGGVVSSGTYRTGDWNRDFGNTLYNDHHFHYGYFIHAAAIIAYLDPSWLSTNKDWVDMLVRDAANPCPQADNLFPFSRAFDWYHGHSWAKGLFESADSKDEESSSEDAFFAYALKMWGQVTGDASMKGRGELMLSILSRSMANYFLMDSENTIQPANFIANKVTGIVSPP